MRRRTLPIARAVALGLVLASLCSSGCKPKKPTVEQAPIQPVPAPAGLLADAVATTPDTTLQRLRGKLGGPAQMLPATFPSLVVSLVGLPITAAELIDANLPVYGALLDDPGKPQFVFGVHVREGARLVTLLSSGNDARFDAKPDPSGLIALEPKPSQAKGVATLAVSNNYLLIGSSDEAVKRAGPYVARTLPTRPAVKEEFVLSAGRAALAGPIATRMREGWAAFRKEKEKQDAELRALHGGKAPDFADPTAAIADLDSKVNRIASLVSDLDEARVILVTDDFGLRTQVLMTPAAGGGVASAEIKALTIGSISPILESPRDSLLSLVFHDNPEQRKAGAREQADGLSLLLGDRIKAAEKAKLQSTLSNWSTGRGDWVAASLVPGEESKSFVVKGAVSNAEAFDKALLGGLDLLGISAFSEPLKQHLGSFKFAKPATAGDTKTVRVHREYTSKDREGKEQLEKSDFDFAWQVDASKGLFNVVIANDSKTWVGASVTRRASLSEDADASQALQSIGQNAAFVFFLQPLRLLGSFVMKGGEARAASAPIVFSFGRLNADGWVRLDMSYHASRELLRMRVQR